MNISTSIHLANRRKVRLVFAIVISVSLLLPALGVIISSKSADALVGEYDWILQSNKNNGIVGDNMTFRSVATSSDGGKIAAVVTDEYENIFLSSNSGETWTRANINTAQSWNEITMSSDGVKLAATAYDGYIYTSSDSGATWTERTSAGSRTWQAIASSADGTKLSAVVADNGNAGYIYTSSDSGATWTERTSAGSRTWAAISSSADGMKLAAVVGQGLIYISTDAGNSWTQRGPAGSSFLWSDIASSADGSKLVATTGVKSINRGGYLGTGPIYTSNDSGVTWVQRTNAGVRAWTSVASSADGTKLTALDNAGYIYSSSDTGITWTERVSSGTQRWSDVASSADGNFIVAVVGIMYAIGSVYTSSNFGITWDQQTVSGAHRWNAIASSDDGKKLAATMSFGSLYTSIDSGDTWVLRSSAGTRSWEGIASSADGTKLVAIDYEGYIYTSSDSGASWSEYTSAGKRSWSAVTSSADGTKLVAIEVNWGGSSFIGHVYTSNDSGVSWTQNTAAGSRNWQGVATSTDGTIIYAVSTDGIWRSLDTGSTWSKVNNVGLVDSFWSTVAMTSDGKSVVVADTEGTDGEGGYVYVSHDYGANWTQSTTLGAKYWKDYGGAGIVISEDGKKIVIADMYGAATTGWYGGYIYSSLDGGMSWVENRDAGAGEWTNLAMSKDGSIVIGTSAYYQKVIFRGFLAQPTIEFTPSANPSDDPIIPTSTNPAAPQLITQTQPTFTGVTYPNSPVTVTVHSDPITCSTVSDAQGNWSCTLPASIPPGNHTVVIELTNTANNQTEQLGPYYVQVLGSSTTISNTTPFAPNTGIRPKNNALIVKDYYL